MNFSLARIYQFTAIALFAGSALMQGAQQGTFHLPVEAHWGLTVLEPGDYSLSLPALSLGETQIVVQTGRKMVFEMPAITENQPYSASSFLKLSSIDGEYFITEFSSGATGKMYTFTVPKAVRRQLIAGRSVDKSLALSVK